MGNIFTYIDNDRVRYLNKTLKLEIKNYIQELDKYKILINDKNSEIRELKTGNNLLLDQNAKLYNTNKNLNDQNIILENNINENKKKTIKLFESMKTINVIVDNYA